MIVFPLRRTPMWSQRSFYVRVQSSHCLDFESTILYCRPFGAICWSRMMYGVVAYLRSGLVACWTKKRSKSSSKKSEVIGDFRDSGTDRFSSRGQSLLQNVTLGFKSNFTAILNGYRSRVLYLRNKKYSAVEKKIESSGASWKRTD